MKTIKVGQKMTGPFMLEVFDSRNTSINDKPMSDKTSLEDAKLQARYRSAHNDFPVILHDSTGHWQKYEKGDVTEWSIGSD